MQATARDIGIVIRGQHTLPHRNNFGKVYITAFRAY